MARKRQVILSPVFLSGPSLLLKTPNDSYGFLISNGHKITRGRIGDPSVITQTTGVGALIGYAHPNILLGTDSNHWLYTYDTSSGIPVLVQSVAPPALVSGFTSWVTTRMMKPYAGRSHLLCQSNAAGSVSAGFTASIASNGTIGPWVRGADLTGRNPAVSTGSFGGNQSSILDADGQCIYRSFEQSTLLWKFHQLQMTDTGYDLHGPITLPGSLAINSLLHLPFWQGRTDRQVAILRNQLSEGAAESVAYVGLYNVGSVPSGTPTTLLTEIDTWAPPTVDPATGWPASRIFVTQLSNGKHAAILESTAVVDGNTTVQMTWYNDIFGTPEFGSVVPPRGQDANRQNTLIANYFGSGHAVILDGYRGAFNPDRFYAYWVKPKIGRLRVYDGTTWRKA